MKLEDNLICITYKLDLLLEKYSKNPDFNHPKSQNLSPFRDAWGEKWHIGNDYRWCFRYHVGDTQDSSATSVRYRPDEEDCYQIVCGKSRESVCIDKKTSDLNEILDIFEKTIVQNIIGGKDDREN